LELDNITTRYNWITLEDAYEIQKIILEVTEAVSRTLGHRSESIRVLLHEVSEENWGVGEYQLSIVTRIGKVHILKRLDSLIARGTAFAFTFGYWVLGKFFNSEIILQ
jgi:4-oxalocrotonate tautomerase family enzyme